MQKVETNTLLGVPTADRSLYVRALIGWGTYPMLQKISFLLCHSSSREPCGRFADAYAAALQSGDVWGAWWCRRSVLGDNDTLKQLHAVVSGQVQGVNFRFHTMVVAHGLGVTGWVRNLLNGDVEVLAEGTEEQLTDLLRFLHRGPSTAYVTGVKTTWGEASGKFVRFGVEETK